jgi:glycosyltransferase involved in cell wall biosynthesis
MKETPRPFRGRPLRILIVGSLPPPPGGTAISLKLLIDQLSAYQGVSLQVVNTAGIRGHLFAGPLRFARTVFKILRLGFQVDAITLHQVPTGLPFLGPLVLVCARILGKPLIIRIFAGVDYMNMGMLKAWLAHFVTRHADMYLAQTKHLVRLAEKRGVCHVHWYPTSRPMPPDPEVQRPQTSACERFVFVGDVSDVKGVREILKIGKLLPESVSVDIFGPLTGEISLKDFNGSRNVRYAGLLANDQVIPTLRQYDALLLPTFHDGEGYPGVIIEAYAAGLPVICTRWMSLPEIVDQTSGILIPPQDPDALLKAMRALFENRSLYARLRQGAKTRGREFSLDFWANRFALLCANVIGIPSHELSLLDRPPVEAAKHF